MHFVQLSPQRAPERITKERSTLLAALGLAIERCPPLHEGSITINDGQNSQGCPVILHRHRRRISKFVGLRTFHVGHRKQLLAYPLAFVQNAAYGADGFARLAGLDFTFSRAIDPDRIVVEVADDVPDLVSRLKKIVL